MGPHLNDCSFVLFLHLAFILSSKENIGTTCKLYNLIHKLCITTLIVHADLCVQH